MARVMRASYCNPLKINYEMILIKSIKPNLVESIDLMIEVMESNSSQRPTLDTVEFSFLDNKNVCCGICGEIVPYEQLMSDHLPTSHPEVFSASCPPSDEESDTRRLQQHRHLREKLFREKRSIEKGFKMTAYRSAARAPRSSFLHRTSEPTTRKVSSIRVNPRVMSVSALEDALKQKMYEKLNRRVPVTLMDKVHARCGMCNAIISLNKKFEIVHLVRHFNCWHPTVHSCAGSWQQQKPARRSVKLLSTHDFAVVDTGSGTPDSLQCIWCGMFVESHGLAQHFGELHQDDVEVPKCNLCMQELILTARYQERFNIDIQITLPDEHHMKCNLCGTSFSNEVNLENHIQRRHVAGLSALEDPQADEDDVNLEEIGPEAFANSRMTLGKRRRPKRQFIMPALRQAVPLDSVYVEPIAECHWKCKKCDGDIYGAVISAAAIRHYKYNHPDDADSMQYEICKSRLEKISDGCMEFIHPQLIECLLCQQTFNLHQPFNMCRAIRHLKAKHPNLMPEYAGLPQLEDLDVEEDGVGSTTVMQPTMTTAPLPAETTTVVYTQQAFMPVNLAGNLVYATHVASDMMEEMVDDDGEEIIMAPGGVGNISFDADTASVYQQQFMAAGPSTSMTYQTNTIEQNIPMSFTSGIRVFRSPQENEVHYQHAYIDSSVAAKNARLDHGAIARQLPSFISDPHRHVVQSTQPHFAVLDSRLLDGSVVLQSSQQQQQGHPQQYYLLLQMNPTSAETPQNGFAEAPVAVAHDRAVEQQSDFDSPMAIGHDRNMQSANILDDSLLEAQRLTALVSHTLSAADNDDGQPRVLMAGDE